MDCIVHGVTKSWTRLRDFHSHFTFKLFNRYMASFVAQLVKNPPAMRETWVQSLVWEDPLGKERLPTPVFGPGEFHGLYSPWGHKESDMTERLSLSLFTFIKYLSANC